MGDLTVKRLLRLLQLAILPAVLCGMVHAVCSGSSPNLTAASAGQTDVQACLTIAVNGDTVNVPAGSASWSAIAITKAIHLKGAGIGSTIITQSGALSFNPSTTDAGKVFELDGFSFQGNSTHFSGTGWSQTPPLLGLKIHNNAFTGTTGGRAIFLAGMEFGAFYSNTFSGNFIDMSVIGAGISPGTTFAHAFGSVNYPYFEDNSIGNGVGAEFVSETGQGGRMVFRHNTITGYDSGPGSEVFDIHGEQLTGGWTVSSEYYHNTIGVGTTPFRWMHDRGGQAVIMNNTVSRNISFNITEYMAWGGNGICHAYPIAFNTSETYCSPVSGSCFETQIQNSFFYNNIAGGSQQTPDYTEGSGGSCGADPPFGDNQYVQQNREFWIPTFGLESALPATCTANGNTYYGTTDSDKIFKCTSTNTWTTFYTPYTYPHPLRSASCTAGSDASTCGSALQVAAPTFSPVAGTYASTQTVTVTSATASATICYTLDGTVPTADGAGTCTHGTTLANGGTVSVATSATVQALGSLSGDTDSAVGSATYTIGIPVASLAPGSLSFGGVNISTTSVGQTLTLQNTGTAVMSITSISLTGTNTGDFFQSNNCPVGSNLGNGSSCTITVTFTPLAVGSRAASVSVVDGATGSPHTSTLSGTGVQASLSGQMNPGARMSGRATVK
jgi:hypothetical protein